MSKKKLFELFLVAITIITITACSSDKKAETEVKEKAQENKKIIYTTFFPVYDLSSMIIGDKMQIRTIIKGTEQPHDFELKSNDMAQIAKADLIIYNGANMESFIGDLKDVVKDDNKFLDLSQGLTLLESSDFDSENHDNVNPHTWLSVKNAMVQLDTIYEKISSMDMQNDEYYKANLNNSLKEFEKLDKEFEERLSSVKSKEKYFIVSHAAFNYLANDYGLKQVAVTGISPEEEPSAKQLKKIADFVKKHDIKTIFFEGKATPKVAKTLANETNAMTSTLYTMENFTEKEIQMGYLDLMRVNLDNLVASFNE